MSDNEDIHIVFKIANFIFENLNTADYILPIDKLLLFALARRKGDEYIFPSTKTLAKELNITPTYVKQRIIYLKEIGLIEIHEKTGANNFYFLSCVGHKKPHDFDRSKIKNRSTTVDRFDSNNRSTAVDQSTTVDRSNRSTTVSQPVNHSFATGQPQLTRTYINNSFNKHNTDDHKKTNKKRTNFKHSKNHTGNKKMNDVENQSTSFKKITYKKTEQTDEIQKKAMDEIKKKLPKSKKTIREINIENFLNAKKLYSAPKEA